MSALCVAPIVDLRGLWSCGQDAGEHQGVLAEIAAAKEQHEATLVAVPSQTERLPVPWHFPCCGVERGTARYWWRVLSNQCGC